MITARIHRTGATTIDLDFQVTPHLIITRTYQDHHQAAEAKRLFEELTEDIDRLTYVRNLIDAEEPLL